VPEAGEGRVILVAGLSGAGKSTFAERLCAALAGAVHLPLDKYFLEVPAGITFRDWVQAPESIDWPTLADHLRRLRAGDACHTPAIDWRGSGRRLSAGGSVAHPGSREVRGGAGYYVVPGCFAFAAPLQSCLRVFVRAPLPVVAARCAAREVAADEVDHVLAEHSPGYPRILAYESQADIIVSGAERDEAELARVCARISR